MKKLEKQALLNWARQLSDQKLREEYNKAIDILSNAIEDNYYLSIPLPKDIKEKVSIIGEICRERGISLWEN